MAVPSRRVQKRASTAAAFDPSLVAITPPADVPASVIPVATATPASPIAATSQTDLALSGWARAEDALLQSEARLRAVLETAVDAIITIDGRGTIQSVNPATVRLFGYVAAQMIGQNVKMLMPSPYQEEHDGYLERYLRTGQKRIIGIGREVQARRKDGTVFPIDLAVSEVEPGKLFTGIIRDISERRFAEARLREADRMASIGALAAGLGHDMNNVLLPVRAHLNALKATGDLPTGCTSSQWTQTTLTMSVAPRTCMLGGRKPVRS
jgi:PAS domain S-box-containing protein